MTNTSQNESPLNLKPLREQVRDYIRMELNRGNIVPGEYVDFNELGQRLGVSRTPLRDAMLQLEVEGFVTILPRRGIRVNELTLDSLRQLYEIIGALESEAILLSFPRLDKNDVAKLHRFNREMRKFAKAHDWDQLVSVNLEAHGVFIEKANNAEMLRLLKMLKQRLYYWPNSRLFSEEWDFESIREHETLADLVEKGEAQAASCFMRDIHWSFSHQEKFVKSVYFNIFE